MLYKFLIDLLLSALVYSTVLSQEAGLPSLQADSKYATSASKRFNVVLFLASTQCNISITSEALSRLNLSEIIRIKPCTKRLRSQVPLDFGSIVRGSRNTNCDCYKLIESGITALVEWARNFAGMMTAVVSITNTNSEDAIKSFTFHVALERPIIQNGFGLPKDPNTDDQYTMEGNMPELELEPDSNYKYESGRKYKRGIKPEDYANVRRLKRKLVIDPENTQIFEVDGAPTGATQEIGEIPALKTQSENVWDIFGVMSAIKNSFFSNYFTNVQDPLQRMIDEEKGLNMKLLGQVRKPSIFQTVKTTMHQVLQESQSGGFLMVVMGENISEISEPQSELFQSIKFISELTDLKDTLFIVSGSCPKLKFSERTKPCVDMENVLLPVYAKGQGAELLSNANELYDIPTIIKEIITRIKDVKKKPVKREFIDLNPQSEGNNDEDMLENNRIEQVFDIMKDQVGTKKKRELGKKNEVIKREPNGSSNRKMSKYAMLSALFFLVIIFRM